MPLWTMLDSTVSPPLDVQADMLPSSKPSLKTGGSAALVGVGVSVGAEVGVGVGVFVGRMTLVGVGVFVGRMATVGVDVGV